jgi:hypothetical protein
MVAGKNPATIFSFYTALTLPDSGYIDSDRAWFIDLIVAIYLIVTGLSGIFRRYIPCRFDETDAFFEFKRPKRTSHLLIFQSDKPSSTPAPWLLVATYFLDY